MSPAGIPMARNTTLAPCGKDPPNPGPAFCPELLEVLVVVDDDDPDVVVDKQGAFSTRCITFPSTPIGKMIQVILILTLK